MCAQKLTMRMYKDGEKDIHQPIECQVRILPAGLYEFIFPKEHMDVVLTSLRFHEEPPYNAGGEFKLLGMKFRPMKIVRKVLNLEEPPKFKTDKKLLWMDTFVSIIPIGIRHDRELEEPVGQNIGWKHEGI